MKTKTQEIVWVSEDWRDILVDVISLQEFAKRFWGKNIMIPDDYGNDLYEWQYHLGRIVTAKDPKKEIKKYYAGNLNRKTNKRTRKISR